MKNQPNSFRQITNKLLYLLLVLLLVTSTAHADNKSEARRLLQKYCFDCHGPKKQESDMRLDRLKPQVDSLDGLERWVDIGDQLKAGDMPPAEAPQPTVDELAHLIEWVSNNIRQSARKLKKPQRIRVRRLTREQYTATLQDLLGLPLNFGELLPEESPSEEGFTNDAELLNFSGTHMETFVETARAAIDKAVVNQDSPEPGFQFGLSMADFSQAFEQGKFSTSRFVPIYDDGRLRPMTKEGQNDAKLAGATQLAVWRPNLTHQKHPKTGKPSNVPVEFEDGMFVLPHGWIPAGDQITRFWGIIQLRNDGRPAKGFPAEGWLRVKFRAASVIPDGSDPPKIKLVVGYPRLHGFNYNVVGSVTVTAPKGKSQDYEFLVRLETLDLPAQDNEKGHPYIEFFNPRWLTTTQPRSRPRPDNPRDKYYDDSQARVLIESVEVNWPYNPVWPPASHTAILGPADAKYDDDTARAREVLTRFAGRAFRRPVDEPIATNLMQLYQSRREAGASFDDAIRVSLVTTLCSPQFLCIDQSTTSTDSMELDDYALASRLSYLIWNSMPNDRLLDLAAAGKLRDPVVRQAEAQRMIADRRSRRFAEQFTNQWLLHPGFDAVAVNEQIFRSFTHRTKAQIRKETVAFFSEVLQHDLSVLNFVDSDFMMLNNELAHHYGVPDITQDDIHRVPVGEHRGGVLTQSSVLIATGTGEKSHPFRRGVWVLERILGTPPPPPPPVVPALPKEDPQFSHRPLKEQLKLHSKDAACVSCHSRLDPWGLALENYNAIGLWRTDYRPQSKAQVISTSTLPDRTEIDGVAGLKRVILENKQDLFLRNLTRKLLAYALGRQLDATDEPTIDSLLASLKKNDLRLQQLLMEIVKHRAFEQL